MLDGVSLFDKYRDIKEHLCEGGLFICESFVSSNARYLRLETTPPMLRKPLKLYLESLMELPKQICSLRK